MYNAIAHHLLTDDQPVTKQQKLPWLTPPVLLFSMTSFRFKFPPSYS